MHKSKTETKTEDAMSYKIVIVRDIKANVYGNPMFVNSLGGAIRSFGDEIAKEDETPSHYTPKTTSCTTSGTSTKWKENSKSRSPSN